MMWAWFVNVTLAVVVAAVIELVIYCRRLNRRLEQLLREQEGESDVH